MPAEFKVLLLAGAVIAFAYTAIYPQMRVKTLNRMMMLDLGLTSALLFVIGLAYFRTGTRFSLVLFSAPWWVFTLAVTFVIEAPFFYRFCKRWDIDMIPPSNRS